jgi:hypothetical protein
VNIIALTFLATTFLFSWTSFAQERQPIYFDVQGDNLKVADPELRYSFQDKGRKLVVGDIAIDGESFGVKLEGGVLIVNWDSELIPEGEISMINHKGDVLWKEVVAGPGAWTYHDILDPEEGAHWKDGEKFRFCLRKEQERGFVSLCTQQYTIVIKENNVVMGLSRLPSKSQEPSRVYIQGQEEKLEGQKKLTAGDPVSFFATLKSGFSFEFISAPLPLVIRDMIQSETEGFVTLIGEMPAPLKIKSKIFFKESQILWQADVPLKQENLVFPGKAGGVFSYPIEISHPAPQSLRKYLTKKTRSGTYLGTDSLVIEDSAGQNFKWDIEAANKFETNHVVLELDDGTYKHKISQDIYRGGGGEMSLRLTGVATKERDILYMGEGHLSWWFNDILDLQSNLLTKQRWGVSAKYFTSLGKVPVEGEGESSTVAISALDMDLRYRLNPGLWEKDPSVGLIVAYEAVNFGGDNIPKLGFGAFWARSMPELFDKYLNEVPFLKYPKWVDTEFIKYASSLDQDIVLGNDYAINFHGKIMWTPQLFGELGFGMKSYYFTHQSTGQGAGLTTFYGTIGMGRNF